jgi:hypothetical protein
MPDDRRSWSANVDTDFADRFDEYFGAGEYGPRSRSELLENAARMYLQIHTAIDATDYQFSAEPPKRHWVRQAVLDLYRREQRSAGDG